MDARASKTALRRSTTATQRTGLEMTAAIPLRVVEALAPSEIVFEVEEGYPLVPDGVYQALCCGVEIKQTFNTPKAYLRFRIAEGDHSGKIVFRAYNLAGRISKGPATGLRPKLMRGQDLFKMLCRVLNLPANTKPHRVSSRELVNRLCQIKTRTVTHDYKQKPLAEGARYSVVDDVISVLA